VSAWKKELEEAAREFFADRRSRGKAREEVDVGPLYEEIGRLKMELDWLKKKLAIPNEEKRRLIEPGRKGLSIGRQCALVGLARSSYYYRPAEPDPYDQVLMRLLDEQYTRTPFYGVARMTEWLCRQGYEVGPKRVRRLQLHRKQSRSSWFTPLPGYS
jgi:putative transposase